MVLTAANNLGINLDDLNNYSMQMLVDVIEQQADAHKKEGNTKPESRWATDKDWDGLL